MFTAAVLYSVLGFWSNVGSMNVPIITRDTYDLIQFPNCDTRRSSDAFNCGKALQNAIPTGDNRTCTCKCDVGYVTYRDPYVQHANGKYKPQPGVKGCIWYGTYREGCHALRSLTRETYKSSRFPTPIILDLTQPGEVTLKRQDFFNDPGCFTVVPYVQTPGKKEWTKVDVQFTLRRKSDQTNNIYLLTWESDSSDIYAYQGLVMRLDFFSCGQSSNNPKCIMTKIAGTYTDSKVCKRRAADGRCCVFPFVHQGNLYNDCVTTDDMTGPWCAVSLNTATTNGNHKWRENCASSSTIVPSPSIPSPSSSSNKPLPTPRLQPPPPTAPSPLTTTSPSQRAPTPFTTESTSLSRVTTQTIPNERNGTQQVTGPPKATPVVMTVTITAVLPCPRHTPPAASPISANEGPDVGLIVGVVLGVVILLAVVGVLIVCCRRRRKANKRTFGKGVSNEVLAEEPSYASVNGTPLYTRKLTNHGFQESLEMSPELASVVRKRYDAMNESQTSHIYDSVAPDKLGQLPYAVYNMPEADYSLIITPSQKSKNGSEPKALNDDPSRHIYSVLERANDPLKNPEAIDNDRVFVEANPLYGTTTAPDGDVQISSDLASRVYEDPNELNMPRNYYQKQEATI